MEETVRILNEQYRLNVSSLEKVDKGFLSENYILTDGDKKYFLKKYRFNKEDKIQKIHSGKQYFADGGIPVILPIKNKLGKTYFSLDDTYFALFTYIKGRHIERDELNETSSASLGRMLGKIHLRGKESTFSKQEHFSGWDKEEYIARADQLISILKEKKELNDFDRKALEGIHKRKAMIQANTVTFEDLSITDYCLIHGDYHESNVFFDENDNVEYVFDFEKVAYAPRVFELIRSTMYLFFDGTFEIQRIELAKIYLEAYIKIFPISKEELQKGLNLYHLRQLHGFWVEVEHYMRNNNRVDQFLISKQKSIDYLSEHRDDLAEQLFTCPQ